MITPNILIEFVRIASDHDWWRTMTCGQQLEYLKIHPGSELSPDCSDESDYRPSPLSLDQINKIQVDAMKKYRDLKREELGYDPGPSADLEWVKMHAKRFRELLRDHNLSR